MASPESHSTPVSAPELPREAPADTARERAIEAPTEDPAVTRRRELIRAEADRLTAEARARMEGPDAPADPADPAMHETLQMLSRAEFMRQLSTHGNPDVVRILGERTSFAKLISSDFQLLAIAGVNIGSAVLHAPDGKMLDFANLKPRDTMRASLGADSAANGSLLLVDLLPESAMASAVAIDGEPYVYREPPGVDEAGFFRENAQNLQIPAVVRDGSIIEIVSVAEARAGRDRDVRSYRDRMGQTAINQ